MFLCITGLTRVTKEDQSISPGYRSLSISIRPDSLKFTLVPNKLNPAFVSDIWLLGPSSINIVQKEP